MSFWKFVEQAQDIRDVLDSAICHVDVVYSSPKTTRRMLRIHDSADGHLITSVTINSYNRTWSTTALVRNALEQILKCDNCGQLLRSEGESHAGACRTCESSGLQKMMALHQSLADGTATKGGYILDMIPELDPYPVATSWLMKLLEGSTPRQPKSVVQELNRHSVRVEWESTAGVFQLSEKRWAYYCPAPGGRGQATIRTGTFDTELNASNTVRILLIVMSADT